MIKLERSSKPDFLTDEKGQHLTKLFKENGTKVWNIKAIKSPLLKSSHGKCCYCECNMTEESKYMEVEHFVDKMRFPEKVVEWENLLPACKRCNGAKGVHDVTSEPILNPYEQDPREHLKLHCYRMQGLTKIGVDSIDVIDLNHQERLVFKRFEIGNALCKTIEIAWERYKNYKRYPKVQSKNRLYSLVESILLECQPNASYAATTSTVALSNTIFGDLIDVMKSEDVWSEELEELYLSAHRLVLCASDNVRISEDEGLLR